MQVHERLSRPGVSVPPGHTIQQTAELMNSAGVGTVAVIDGEQLMGIATDRDIVRRAVARGIPLDARIDGVMSSPVRTIAADADVTAATAAFGDAAVRRLAVVDHGKFVGILSLDDVLVDLAGQFAIATAPMTSEIAMPQRDAAPPATIPSPTA